MKIFFEHTSASWVRYSNYEWKKTPDGKEYLVPTEDAEPKPYDPMKVAEELVLAAADIGLMLFRREPEKAVKETIRAFACRCGLLGIMTALPTTPRFIEYEKVYFNKNQFLPDRSEENKDVPDETMETKDYIRLFFPFREPDFQKQGVESVWDIEDRKMIALAATYRNDPQAMVMSFMRDYGERYDWLVSAFKDWTFTLVTATLYYTDKDTLDEETLDLYRKGMASFEGNTPTYHLELREHPTLVWDFHSLMLNIRILFSMALTDEKNPLRICRHCQRPFIAGKADAEFCSTSCREQHNEKPRRK